MAISNEGNSMPTMLLVFSVIFSIIPTVAVAFRFQSRRSTKSKLSWDDWTILFALVACIATAILIIIGVASGGMGQHLKMTADGKPIYDHEYVIFQKVNYGIDLAQLLALGPTKASVLLLYRRIFGIASRRFQYISMTLLIIVIMWTIAFFLTNALQYTPVYSMWSQIPSQAHPTFKQSTKMFLAQSYADVALDVLIIILPIPLIWDLQINLRRKLQISAVFLLGALTTASSAARTAVQYSVAKEFNSKNLDKTYYLSPIAYWPLIEASLGIVAACLPLLRPIGQIYSIKNMVLVSSKALSSVFSGSSRSSRQSESGGRSAHDSDGPATREGDSSHNDQWAKQYDISALEKTIDNDTIRNTTPFPFPASVDASNTNHERSYGVMREGTDRY
ncbi:hypothetical protein G7054_g8113 [Neopestalotiopsis clavispora]|nr:hypothetical protein G7054_g8113 [Neopestalotiopsis clavispora]